MTKQSADKKPSDSDFIEMRKKGKQIAEIALYFGVDKMDVRDACKDVDRSPPKAKSKK